MLKLMDKKIFFAQKSKAASCTFVITECTKYFNWLNILNVFFLSIKPFGCWVKLHVFCLLFPFSQEYYQSIKQIGSRSGQTTDISSGLIWVQNYCKGYHQTTLASKELEEKNKDSINLINYINKFSLLIHLLLAFFECF